MESLRGVVLPEWFEKRLKRISWNGASWVYCERTKERKALQSTEFYTHWTVQRIEQRFDAEFLRTAILTASIERFPKEERRAIKAWWLSEHYLAELDRMSPNDIAEQLNHVRSQAEKPVALRLSA